MDGTADTRVHDTRLMGRWAESGTSREGMKGEAETLENKARWEGVEHSIVRKKKSEVREELSFREEKQILADLTWLPGAKDRKDAWRKVEGNDRKR